MTGEEKKNKLINSLSYFIGVIASFLVAFYIRTIPKAGVFISENFVRFGGNDPWYHLRNVENILHNFPDMLWFDAYTQFPNGTEQVFAPLFDMILAFILWIIGLGDPSQSLIHTFSAYYPTILGALVVIPTYFAGKWLYDRRVGLLSAILVAIAPGQFLSRSMIGFNDHHIAETLFSTIVAALLIIAIVKARQHNISFENLKNKNFSEFKQAIPYFIFTGIALGLYTLSWKGALFFSFIIGVYITIQHIIDHLHGRSTDYLAIGGITIFFVTLIMVLITPELGGSKSLNIKGLLGGILAFPILTGISIALKNKDLKRYYYPFAVAAFFIAGIGLARLFSPSAYQLVTNVGGYFMRTGGALTIAEASPLLNMGGQFSFAPLWFNFGTLALISFLALAFLAYKSTKENTPERTFLIIWSIMVIWAMLQQNRFAYYYSVNASLLSAFIGIKILDFAGWQTLTDNFREKLHSSKEKLNFGSFLKNNLGIWHIIAFVIVILVLIVPTANETMNQTRGVGGPQGQWIEGLQWLEYNTPDPGLDYYESYEIPEDGSYDYPDEAYGVMSWWDYGHWIEVIGHRIPNANPFQQGIGGRRGSINDEAMPGASTFFTAPSEEKATEVLEEIHPDPDKAGARYVVSDAQMATGKFYAMAAWTLDTKDYYVQVQTQQGQQRVPGERYYNSMEARLHIFDGDGLEQYRMVHETRPGNSPERGYKQVYNVLHGGNLELQDTGFVKIFEYVEGAKVQGTAPEDTKVTISVPIRTSQGRTFEYSQTTTSDGTYSFTVPYSTEGPIQGETQFDTMPTEPYTISYNNVTEQVSVTERDVLDGNTVEVQ
ncbi:Oligosaccharyl transferase STT3 subunit [Methanohalobium evestigatum Z-7303]|uniref:dolichyl-phosphooligosaccharide-protein glycotransferase n=1 Tax=Methanohalobium evestigatum (strain ATCC BAA-1072 / DSM 3721 / NBRC 107634 / OCM 161 / Z-7303) TaxID=644295 RepID=D7E7Q1_METEZ|nr:oligosaccharyl transferase, archaeosortase A system-associated [Methanohalobium evestigatum]ADI74124.1 Oligosaccharyl transferase STT3 subunit [Methanohalobium evestigatum Z-7303]